MSREGIWSGKWHDVGPKKENRMWSSGPFKPGDKVMFLGVRDLSPDYSWCAQEDSLKTMAVYEVKKAHSNWGIDLVDKEFHYPVTYFQKVREEKL